MQKEKIVTIGIVVLVLMLAGGIIFSKNFSGGTIQDTPLEEATKWIGEHAVLYVQTGCSHCKDQEDLFGVNLRYLTIINCLEGDNKQQCINAGIESTPTWIIDGQKYVGVKTIDELKELTNYQD